jgi:hypothetical protein
LGKNVKPTSRSANINQQSVVVHQYPHLFEWLGTAGVAVSQNRYTKWLLLLLLAVLTLFQNPQSSGGDYDFFFHLKYGDIYFHNHTWKLDHSQFSWTPSIADWRYVTWIGNILIYLFYNIASGNGVLILQWLVFGGAFFLVLKHIHASSDRLDANYILLALTTITTISVVDLYIKPDLFSTLFFGLTIYIYIYTKTTSRNIFYLYPPLFLIWTNTHGGFVNGIVFIGMALFGELVNFIFFKKAALSKKLLLYFLIAVVVSCLATLINPYGYKYLTHLYATLFSKEAYDSLAKPLLAYRVLWNHIFSTGTYKLTNAAWSILFMEAILLLLLLYGFVKKKFFDFSLLLTSSAFFYLSMGVARAAKYFPVLCIFLIIYLLKMTGLQEFKKKFGIFSLILFILFAGRLTYQTFWYSSELPSWNYANLINDTPKDAVRFIKDNKLPGPIFNDYLIGGYLLWDLYPDYKVFIDPRQSLYVDQVWPDYQKYVNSSPLTLEKLQEFTKKYPFKIAIIHYAYFSIIDLFLRSPDWKLIYFDRVAAVIINKSVVPTLTRGALMTEAGTVRFKDVKNASILLNLFNFYIIIGPSYARDIIEFYRQNVNDLYVNKQQNILAMEQVLQQRINQVPPLQKK